VSEKLHPHPLELVGQRRSNRPTGQRYPQLSRVRNIASASTQTGHPSLSSFASGTQSKHRCILEKKPFLCMSHNSRIRQYMLSEFFHKDAIPLWWPSPPVSLSKDRQRINISVGDIGAFNDNGGFDVFFNVFLSEEENNGYGLRIYRAISLPFHPGHSIGISMSRWTFFPDRIMKVIMVILNRTLIIQIHQKENT